MKGGKYTSDGPTWRASTSLTWDMSPPTVKLRPTSSWLVNIYLSCRIHSIDKTHTVTDSHGRIIRKGYESRVPRTAAEFADYFCNSEFARANHEDTEAYRQDFVGKRDRESRYEQSFQREHARRSIKKSPFIASIGLQMRVLMRRRVQIIRGDSAAQVIQLVSSLLQAVVVGTVYLRLDDDTNSFFSRAGVLFFSLLFVAMASMAEIPALFAQRPIVYRQSRAAMYHPFVEALAHTMVDVPITLVNQIVFGVPLYFIVGLQQSAGQFL